MNRGFFTYASEEEKDSKVNVLDRYDLEDLRGAKRDDSGSLKFINYMIDVCQTGDTVYVVSFSETGCSNEEQLEVLRYIIDQSIKIRLADGVDNIVAVSFSAEGAADLFSLIQMACKAGLLG